MQFFLYLSNTNKRVKTATKKKVYSHPYRNRTQTEQYQTQKKNVQTKRHYSVQIEKRHFSINKNVC